MLVFPSVGVLDIVRSSFAAPRWAHAPSICIELTPSGGMLHPTFPSCTPIVQHRMFACHALLHSAPSSYDPACALRVLLFIAHSPFAAPCWAHLPSPCSRRESPHRMLPSGPSLRIAGSHVRPICVLIGRQCMCAVRAHLSPPLGGVLPCMQTLGCTRHASALGLLHGVVCIVPLPIMHCDLSQPLRGRCRPRSQPSPGGKCPPTAATAVGAGCAGSGGTNRR